MDVSESIVKYPVRHTDVSWDLFYLVLRVPYLSVPTATTDGWLCPVSTAGVSVPVVTRERRSLSTIMGGKLYEHDCYVDLMV